MSTVDYMPHFPLLYINDHGVVTCNLGCDTEDFTYRLIGRRHSVVALLLALGQHLQEEHPGVVPELSSQLRYMVEDHCKHPQQQTKRDEVHPGGNTSGGEEEAQRRTNQQDQYYKRHVDPLALRPRFET